jgi:hypothetical protein
MRLVAAAFLLVAGMAFPEISVGASSNWLVYFGTYTGPNSKGIYVSDYDPASGRIGDIRLAGEITRPSWILADKSGAHLYAVSELGNDSRTNGEVSSFSIDRATGKLTFINKVSSGGGGACHLALDKDGKTLFVADYGSGRVAAIRIKPDGSLGDQPRWTSTPDPASIRPGRKALMRTRSCCHPTIAICSYRISASIRYSVTGWIQRRARSRPTIPRLLP